MPVAVEISTILAVAVEATAEAVVMVAILGTAVFRAYSVSPLVGLVAHLPVILLPGGFWVEVAEPVTLAAMVLRRQMDPAVVAERWSFYVRAGY